MEADVPHEVAVACECGEDSGWERTGSRRCCCGGKAYFKAKIRQVEGSPEGHDVVHNACAEPVRLEATGL